MTKATTSDDQRAAASQADKSALFAGTNKIFCSSLKVKIISAYIIGFAKRLNAACGSASFITLKGKYSA